MSENKRSYYSSKLPLNTLINADDTPNTAYHDEKSLGQIAFEAFRDRSVYLGYAFWGLTWNQCSEKEQQLWGDIAETVLGHVHPSSS